MEVWVTRKMNIFPQDSPSHLFTQCQKFEFGAYSSPDSVVSTTYTRD